METNRVDTNSGEAVFELAGLTDLTTEEANRVNGGSILGAFVDLLFNDTTSTTSVGGRRSANGASAIEAT